MAWFGRNKNDDALDRLEAIASKLDADLRKVVIELSAAAEAQRIAAEHLETAALARTKHQSPWPDAPMVEGEK